LKALTSFECKYQITLAIFFVFVDANEDLIMADDVVTPSNPLIMPVKEEKFEKIPFDVNIFQWPCEEEPFRRVVRTRINRSAWDCQLSPNSHALVF